MKGFAFFAITGAAFAGVGRAGHIFAEAATTSRSVTVWEVAQGGGTGGLIICLIAAVIALWRDRNAVHELLRAERAAHQEELRSMQQAHANLMEEKSKSHKNEIEKVTSTLMDELRSQIAVLRSDQQVQLDNQQSQLTNQRADIEEIAQRTKHDSQ